MSTLKSINVQHPSATTINIVNDSSGNVTVGNNLTVTGNTTTSGNETVTGTLVMGSSFKRNRIINGNMNVAQRGTSFTDGNGYTLDRWYGNRSGGVAGMTYAQVYGAFGTTTNAMSIQRTSGNTSTAVAVLYQAIEGINSRDLAGKTVTVSFQVGAGLISSTTGHSVIVAYQTTTTDIGPTSGGWTQLTGQSFTVVSGSSFTQKTFQFSIPSTATQLMLIIQFAFSGTAGADDRFYLTQVQLEQGSVATPYEMQIYSDQLAQCQRYYQFADQGVSGAAVSATVAILNYYPPVQFRTFPTLALTAAAKVDFPYTANYTQSSASVSSSFGSINGGINMALINFSGLTTYSYLVLRNDGGKLTFSAEL